LIASINSRFDDVIKVSGYITDQKLICASAIFNDIRKAQGAGEK